MRTWDPAENENKRRHWPWRDWYGEFIHGRPFPDEFGDGLEGLFALVRRKFRNEEYGPWCGPSGEDRRCEFLLRVVRAIVRSKELRGHYERGFNHRQFFGYFRKIMEREIPRLRRDEHPVWYRMEDRVMRIAKSKLSLIDDKKRFYIPKGWYASGKEFELLEAELEERLMSVPVRTKPVPSKLSGNLLERIIERLFDAAQAPIRLDMLTTHTMS